MKRQSSQFVGAFDVASKVFRAFANAVYDAGGDDDDVRRIENDTNLKQAIGKLVVGERETGNIFKVVVDYGKSLAEMIAAGKYDRANSDITERHFSVSKPPAGLPAKAELNLELVRFNKYITSEEAIAELKKRGLRPATLPELLAFGAVYKEKQRGFPIVALGSVWRCWSVGRNVPYLWGNSGARNLRLGWFGGGWSSGCRFLAVREV